MPLPRALSPRHILIGSAATIIALSGRSYAVDNFWTGNISNDWNVATNWSLGRVPTNANGDLDDPFDDAILNVLTNFPVITADLLATPRDIVLGSGTGTSGRVDHRSGTVTAARLLIGREEGTGTYNLANTAVTGGLLTGFGVGSGSLNIDGRIYIGGVDDFTAGSVGTFNVNTTGSVTIGNDLTIGSAGSTGAMNVDTGTITVGHWTFIGRNEGSIGGDGTLRIRGGSITNSGGRTFIGLGDSTGSMQMSGGVYNNIAGGNDTFFAIGVNNLNTATTPTLNMTGGTINSAHVFSVGGVEAFGGNNDVNFVGTGKGLMTVDGPSANINSLGEFWVGQGAGSVGELTLDAGTITVSNWIDIGRFGAAGKVTVNGGTLTKSGAGHFLVGDGPGANGSLTQTGGTISITSGELWVAQNSATGEFNMSGGTLTVGNWTAIGRVGGTGTMNFSGGTFTKSGGGVFIIADPVGSNLNTTGVLNQSGNSSLVTNEIWVGQGNGGNGTYNLSAGSINSSGWIAIGRERGTGVVEISGTGSMIKSGANSSNIIVGSLGGDGTVNQTGGSVVMNPGAGSILMGEGTSKALWDLSGGTVSTDALVVGWNGGENEFRVRDAGSLTSGFINVGDDDRGGSPKGVVTQTGGTITSNSWIAVGIGSSQEAEYNLSGGTTNSVGFEVADTLGTVRVSGTGILNVSNSIEMPTRNGTGVFEISGGTVSTSSFEQGGRDGFTAGSGTTNQSGGIVTVASNLVVQRPGVGLGTYNLSGGTLIVNGSIQATLGTFTFTGGKITRSIPGATTFNGNLTTGASAATLGLGPDITFQINGALDNTAGLTLDLTGLEIPDQLSALLTPVTGSFMLGNVAVIPAPGAFDIGKTFDIGFDSTFEVTGQGFFTATRINEDALFNPQTQSVYWLDEDDGAVTLQYSIIPEPNSIALAMCAGLMALSRRRRRGTGIRDHAVSSPVST